MLQEFRRSEEGNAKFLEILFIAGNDAITEDGFGTGCHKAVFKILCFSLERSEDIIIEKGMFQCTFLEYPLIAILCSLEIYFY